MGFKVPTLAEPSDKVEATGVGTFGAVSHLLGQKWRTLTEVQKKPYNQMYAADRERYEREMESFRAKYSLQF